MKDDIKIAIVADDKIDYMYVGEEQLFHSVILKEYILKNYPNAKVNFENANNMALFLREKGLVVFLNDTTYKNQKPDIHGKTGVFIFPDTLSEIKKELVLELNEKLQDFDAFQVWYEFESHDECKNIFTRNKDQVKTIIPYVLDKITQKIK